MERDDEKQQREWRERQQEQLGEEPNQAEARISTFEQGRVSEFDEVGEVDLEAQRQPVDESRESTPSAPGGERMDDHPTQTTMRDAFEEPQRDLEGKYEIRHPDTGFGDEDHQLGHELRRDDAA